MIVRTAVVVATVPVGCKWPVVDVRKSVVELLIDAVAVDIHIDRTIDVSRIADVDVAATDVCITIVEILAIDRMLVTSVAVGKGLPVASARALTRSRTGAIAGQIEEVRNVTF